MTQPPLPPDGELLRAFRMHGDQAAFAELVRRYGRLVLGAAQSVVGEASAAQDVLQATFLALSRKALRLERQASVIGWLLHVAVCLARNDRKKERRRQAREQEAAMLAKDAETTVAGPEAALRALHEELELLAERYRQPILLHHFAGLSYAAAAELCGCSDKAFSVRLVRARERLRQRLVARGVTLGADGIGGVLEEGATAAVLPAALVAATCQAASLLAAGKTLTGSGLVSAKVASLTKSALKTLFWAKVKTAAAAVVVVTGIVVGGGLVAHRALVRHTAVPPPTPAAAAAHGGQVWAWGSNQYGQLGDGTANSSPIPAPVPGLDGVLAVTAGFGHTVALRSDSSVWAWGQNQDAQLGDGTTTDRQAPVPVKMADGTQLCGIAAVAAGWGHTVALKRDGGVLVWGMCLDDRQPADRNHAGVLARLPRSVALSGITAIAAGWGHTVALRSDTTVWAWGINDRGQLGDGTKTDRPTPVPVKLPDGSPLSGVIALAAGGNGSVALRNDRAVWTWGNFGGSSVGFDGPVNGTETLTPVPVKLADGAPLSGITAIAAGNGHVVALRSDTTVWAWGGNIPGQLGDGTKTYQPTPVPVKLADRGQLSGIIALAAGGRKTVALRNDRTVWAWGADIQAWPVQVKLADGSPLGGVTAIAAGDEYTVALVGENGSGRSEQ